MMVADDHVRLAHLGSVIRERRAGRYSVKELSRLSGVSAGLISQIERGVGNPSITTLTRLAYALDLSISSFFESGPVTLERGLSLVTASSRKRLIMPGHSLEYQLLTPNLQGVLGMVRTMVMPQFDNRTEPFRHEGEECVHLLRGRLGIVVNGEECVMEEGDTVTYDCGLPHAWWNSTEEPAEVLAAMSPPSF